MKKILCALLLMMSLCACGCNEENARQHNVDAMGYKTVVVDSCEYVVMVDVMRPYGFVHKGNCKNPIHKSK